MLIRFAVSNYRSIADRQELSLVAIDNDRLGARHVPRLNASLLCTAAIYGPNASGKSNVLSAIAWLRDAIAGSLRSWDQEIPVDPFAFGAWPLKRTEFEYESEVDGIRYEYLLELDAQAVAYEALFHYPEGRRRRVYEREGEAIVFQRGFAGGPGTRDLLTPQTLALSAARRFGEGPVAAFARPLLATTFRGALPGTSRRFGSSYRTSTKMIFAPNEPQQETLFEQDAQATDLRQRALALLRLADLGVSDVKVDTVEAEVWDEKGHPTPMPRTRIRLIHTDGEVNLPFDDLSESRGTLAWFNLIGPILRAIESGGLIVVDELDASLHPTLSAQLIALFASPEINQRGAQLVFSTHDTSLLAHLNRDEVWLTEKTDGAATRLGPLSAFAGQRVRTSSDLERGYLSGRFGALPNVDQYELLRALHLIG